MSDPIALLTRKNLPAPEHLEALAAAGLQPVVGSLADQDLPEDRVAVLMPGLERIDRAALERFPNLGLVVLGHQVGDTRLWGGRPPSALWRRSVL